MRSGAPSKPESAMNIFKGDDVSPTAVNESLNGIKSNYVTRMICFQIFWLPEHLLPVCLLRLPKVTYFLWKDTESSHIVDESSNGGSRRSRKATFSAEWHEQLLQFCLAEVGVLHT